MVHAILSMTVTDDSSILATDNLDIYEDIPAAAIAGSMMITDRTSMLGLNKR
jgi:hypothetical protein